MHQDMALPQAAATARRHVVLPVASCTHGMHPALLQMALLTPPVPPERLPRTAQCRQKGCRDDGKTQHELETRRGSRACAVCPLQAAACAEEKDDWEDKQSPGAEQAKMTARKHRRRNAPMPHNALAAEEPRWCRGFGRSNPTHMRSEQCKRATHLSHRQPVSNNLHLQPYTVHEAAVSVPVVHQPHGKPTCTYQCEGPAGPRIHCSVLSL
jgi:hypothetical protein